MVSRLTRRIPASSLKQLEAGHSVTLTMVWNGRPNQPLVHALKPGSYAIDVAYGDYGSSTTIALRRQRRSPWSCRDPVDLALQCKVYPIVKVGVLRQDPPIGERQWLSRL